MKRKSCLVIGYMRNNFGDDLFFKILFERYPHVDFYMYPPVEFLRNYKRAYKKYKNVKFYDKEKYFIREAIINKGKTRIINLFPMICERAKKVDFYINIGGSIFIQHENWKKDDRFIIKEILGSKPSFIIGCNFGPGNKEYEKHLTKWFEKFDDICFRDADSYDKFKTLKNTRLSDDIVLTIHNKNKPKKKKKNQKIVAISIIDLDNRKDLKELKKQYFKYLEKKIKKLLEKNYKIKLFSFCKDEGDEKAIKQLLKHFNEKERKKIKVIKYKSNINKFLSNWQKCSLVIGSRFHSVVLAMASNQKFFALSYSKKIENFISSYDKNIKVLNIKDLKKNKKSNLEFYEINKEYNAEQQFIKLDNYLNTI